VDKNVGEILIEFDIAGQGVPTDNTLWIHTVPKALAKAESQASLGVGLIPMFDKTGELILGLSRLAPNAVVATADDDETRH